MDGLKNEIAYWIIKLLVKMRFIEAYCLDDIGTRIIYDDYGYKNADEIFSQIAEDLDREGIGFVEKEYKDILEIGEPASVRARSWLFMYKRKQEIFESDSDADGALRNYFAARFDLKEK